MSLFSHMQNASFLMMRHEILDLETRESAADLCLYFPHMQKADFLIMWLINCKPTFFRGYLFSRPCLHRWAPSALFSRNTELDCARAMHSIISWTFLWQFLFLATIVKMNCTRKKNWFTVISFFLNWDLTNYHY